MTHWATFEPKEPIGFDGGTVLTFTLHQQFNARSYTLGRFRLSVTTARRSRSAWACRRARDDPGDRRRAADRGAADGAADATTAPSTRSCARSEPALAEARSRCRSIPKLEELQDDAAS